MGRIRILSDNVANKIAAGEVVERPASVVKELLENSLDAGATEVRIAIENGGRRLIRIQDNGCGMMRDDALLAFERHATSKLSDVRDLDSIATLGFRGEALPSIASVSRLLLETHSSGETTGTRVEIAGGRLLTCDEAAVSVGTTISVRDLFFNVPARKKFLRSEPTELAHIASLVTHYSLAHPAKAFALSHNDRPLLDVTPVTELRERVYQVFGGQTLDDLVDIGDQRKRVFVDADAPEREFRVRGFVSGPQVQKMNRNSIYLFVNGRLIRDKLLLHALSAAYYNLMPAACYPFALLFLDCDAEEVDVNVHPAKTEVRFRHGSIVHDFVRDTIRALLMERRPITAIPLSASAVRASDFGAQAGAILPYSEFTQRIENMSFDALPVSFGEVPLSALPEFSLRPGASITPRFTFDEPQPDTSAILVADVAIPLDPNPIRRRIPMPDSHGTLALDPGPDAESLAVLADLRPLGQIHDSFILAAGRDGLWIIDQHVAHERILFEKVLRQRAAGRAETQQLLIPLVIELTASQQIEYARLAGELDALGFDTEPFGNRTIAIKSAPAAIGPGEIEKVIFEVLEIAESELRHTSLDDFRRSIAASIACQAAIKINMRLDQTKMEWLLRELAACEFPMSCPHGRPIALRYTTREILRSFHRI